MSDLLRRFWNETSGATAVEYAILAGLVAAVVAGAVALVGESVIALFHEPELTSALGG
jgi:pilus assembly protein Flp/PilA